MGGEITAHICTFCILSLLTVGTESTPLGDKLSNLIKQFANDGLGVGEMQEYVSTEVTFETKEITGNTVAKIANDMSEKLQRRRLILEELQETIAESYSNDTDALNITMEEYQTCCEIELKEDNRFLNAKVNLENWCLLGDTLGSESPPEEMLPRHIMEKFRSKYSEEDGLKYIYYGSEDGILYNFPGIKYCGSYDPRFRPWYVQAATPEAKDVVIVIDRSGSMKSSISSGGQTLMEVAIDAAITVVNTLNPNDKVGIVTFSTNAETPPGTDDTCFNTSLAKANPQNKKYLRSFISDIIAAGDTYYNKAFNKAFSYFKNTPQDEENTGQRDKVVLFLTDGSPSEDDIESIYSNLKDLNAQLQNEVVVLTYFLSSSPNPTAEEILTNLANQTIHEPTHTRGTFTHVSDPENLRSEMASFYQLFQPDQVRSIPSFSAPFLDIFNTSNIQISMCLPVKSGVDDQSSLKGVVCIDHSVDDILSDVTYFKKGDLAYAFVIDSQARVLSHPLLTNPVDISADPLFVQLPSLEIADGIEDVMESMIRGGTGHRTLQSLRVTPRGSLYTEGVDTLRTASTYYWHPVEGTSFSVCIVSSNQNQPETIIWDQEYPQEFVYHLNRIYDDPRGTCRLFAREALRDLGNVKFSPRAFVDPYTYIYGEETAMDLNAYEDYFTGRNETNPGFREGVRDEVALSYRFEELMESRDEYADYAIWRYMATETGIIRVFPGSEVPVMFDALVRSWYIRSMSTPSLYSISTPYNDALGAGIVVTISKAILTPSKDAVGVMGMDFTLAYLHELLTQEIQECSSTNECFIIDQSGFIVLHSKWLRRDDGQQPVIEGVHISAQEPEVAFDLVTQILLQKHSCINLEALSDQVFWKMRYSKDNFEARSWYELHEVPQTNIYVIVKKGSPPQLGECSCPQTQAIEMCSAESQTCFCPCFVKTDVYSYCTGTFTLTQDGDPPCSPPVPSIDFSYISKREENIVKNLEICRDYQCDKRSIRSECVGVASCSWCAYTDDGTSLAEPYCSTWDKCAFGIGPARTTVKNVDDDGGISPGILAVAIAVPIAAAIAIIVVTIFLVRRYCNRKSEKSTIHRTNTTPNPYFGVKGAEASADAGKNSHYAQNFKLQHTSMPVTVAPNRPKSYIDDLEMYDDLRESHLFPPPPSDMLEGFRARPRMDSLPPTPPPEELPDNYDDALAEVSASNTMPFSSYETSKADTLPGQQLPRCESDVYLQPKNVTLPAKDSGYTGLGSVMHAQTAEAGARAVATVASNTPDDSQIRRDSDVYLKAQSVKKAMEEQVKQSEDVRDSYRRLVEASPHQTTEKY